MELFFVDQYGELKVNAEEFRVIPEFRVLWSTRVLVEKDKDAGRKKLYQFEALKLIWLLEHYKSPHYFKDEDIKLKDALADTSMMELKPDFTIKDKTFHNARMRFRKEYDIVELRILRGIKEGLENADLLIKYCNKRIRKVIELEDENETGVIDPQALATAFKALEDILDLASTVPKKMEEITAYEKKVLHKAGEKKFAKGGKEVGNRADPKVGN